MTTVVSELVGGIEGYESWQPAQCFRFACWLFVRDKNKSQFDRVELRSWVRAQWAPAARR